MTLDPSDDSRAIIPLWRPFADAQSVGELLPISALNDSETTPSEALVRLHHEWTSTGARTVAAELVAGALVEGVPDYGRSAAEALSVVTDRTSRALNVIVSDVLGKPVRAQHRQSSPEDEIRRLRQETERRMQDPFAWAELARAFAGLGLVGKAERAMIVALTLAPHNRYLLRSAARLFQHFGDVERAHHLLLRAPQLKRDPWLLATELAIASLIGRTSRHMRQASLLSADIAVSPWQLAELRSAVATTELAHGGVKKARKLFRGSLEAPNDNAVAQAHWVARRHDPGLRSQISDISISIEAVTWQAYKDERWNDALEASQKWHEVEPFSSTPLILGTHLAASCLLDYSKALELATLGLRANPENFTLANNFAYAAARVGKVAEAEKVLSRIEPSQLSDRQRVVYSATSGLVAFRKGMANDGRRLYRDAIASDAARKDPTILASALLNFAMEESVLDVRKDALRLAEEALSKVASGRFVTLMPLAQALSERIAQAIESETPRGAQPKPRVS